MSGSAASVPNRQALDSILVFLLAFQFFARIPKEMEVGEVGRGVEVVGSLRFDLQGWGVSPDSDPFGQTEKVGRGCKN